MVGTPKYRVKNVNGTIQVLDGKPSFFPKVVGEYEKSPDGKSVRGFKKEASLLGHWGPADETVELVGNNIFRYKGESGVFKSAEQTATYNPETQSVSTFNKDTGITRRVLDIPDERTQLNWGRKEAETHKRGDIIADHVIIDNERD